MKHTGIFITKEELEHLKVEHETSGMFLTGGVPMGNPQQYAAELEMKYYPPAGYGINLSTGEWEGE